MSEASPRIAARRTPAFVARRATEIVRAEGPRGLFLAVLSDLAVATGEALEAAGIRIPFPQQDLHLRNAPELGNALADALRRERSSKPDEPS